MTNGALNSFGNVFAANGRPVSPDRWREAGSPVLAYGNGRSYGDSCLNSDGALVDMRSRNRILAYDTAAGVIEAEAGTMLPQIIGLMAPLGWFLPVTPGTRHVTLGGAIANDVHGKNHHRRGTFGCHVEALTLERSDGSVHQLKPGDPLFAATIGGMGLTGIITRARIRMMRVPGLAIAETVTPFSSLDAFFDLADEADRNNEYAVAWIDQLARGKAFGRGLLLAGNHVADDRFKTLDERVLPGLPFVPPVSFLNTPSIKVFNHVYRTAKSRGQASRISGPGSFFYPLDAVTNWNRFYGPRGLFQHQSVVPADGARETVAKLLGLSQDAGHASFLTVLKRFGDVASPGVLSFPRAGYTLTLDFPNRGRATLDLMERLDALTIAAGGAVNPYKDARMSAETFRASFPGWEHLEAMRDPAFMSDFWKRTAMTFPVPNGNSKQNRKAAAS